MAANVISSNLELLHVSDLEFNPSLANPNLNGEYPLSQSHLEAIEGFTEAFRTELAAADGTMAPETTLPFKFQSKTVKLAFERREDADVHSIFFESDTGLYSDPIRMPNQAIVLIEPRDGSPTRGKMFFYRNCDGRQAGMGQRPLDSHISKLQTLQQKLFSNSLGEETRIL